MKTIKAEIELQIPDGYTFVRLDGEVEEGEQFKYLESDNIFTADKRTCPTTSVVVIKKEEPFTLPSWIKPGVWYARDKDGDAYLYANKPTKGIGCWNPVEGDWEILSADAWYTTLQIKPFEGPWEDSLYQQPEQKQ